VADLLRRLRQINKHDKTDSFIRQGRSLVDSGIRVDGLVKSIFTDLERKVSFSRTEGSVLLKETTIKDVDQREEH